MDPHTPYPILPIIHVLAVIIVIFSLPAQLRAWNAGVYIYAFLLVLVNICQVVDSIIWPDNVNDVAPDWCDFGEWGPWGALY